MNVKKDELIKIPFVDNVPNDGRIICSTMVYLDDTKDFAFHIPLNENKLQQFKGNPIEGIYWSKEIIDNSNDIYLNTIHMLCNNLSFPFVSDCIYSIVNDIYNFGIILQKQIIIFDYFKNNENRNSCARTYKTEVEYFVGLIRSFYGLKFDILKFLYNKFRKVQLPDSLGKIADNDFNLIIKKYKFEEPIIEYFTKILPLFRLCRKIRDDIYHRGSEPDIIFETENGPGVSINDIPFSYLKDYLWNDQISLQGIKNKNIGSLFYFFTKLIQYTLNSLDLFGNLISKSFTLSPPISNEHKIFVRGEGIKFLNKIPEFINNYWLC